MYVPFLQIVGLNLCQKTMGPGGRSRQVQPVMDLAQVAEAASKLSSLLEQVSDVTLHIEGLSLWTRFLSHYYFCKFDISDIPFVALIPGAAVRRRRASGARDAEQRGGPAAAGAGQLAAQPRRRHLRRRLRLQRQGPAHGTCLPTAYCQPAATTILGFMVSFCWNGSPL